MDLQERITRFTRADRALTIQNHMNDPISGTGKTSIAKCLASEVNIPLITISCSSLLSPYLGEAEKNLKLFFEYARKNSTQEQPGTNL